MQTIYVDIAIDGINTIYEPQYISFGDNCVIGCGNSRAMSFLLGDCTAKEAEERKKPIQAQMDQYNSAVEYLWRIPGFKEYFAEHNSYVTFDEIEKEFGKEAVENASKVCRISNCYPDLIVQGDALLLSDVRYMASFCINGDSYSYCSDDVYVDTFVAQGKICSFDWSEDESHRTFAFIHELWNAGIIKGDTIDDEVESLDYLFQYNTVADRNLQAMKYSLKLLEKRGYLHTYNLKPQNESDLWNRKTKRADNTVLFTVLDPAYKKDKLLCERLNCLWNSLYINDEDEGHIDSELSLDSPFYFLQDKNDCMYITASKAKFGGHKKLKIYGRLDCPSANRYVKAGKYVQHRVFFEDEETAIAAGYRPCGVCMPEAYKKWKEANK